MGLPKSPVLPKIAKIENLAEIVELSTHEGPYIPISQTLRFLLSSVFQGFAKSLFISLFLTPGKSIRADFTRAR